MSPGVPRIFCSTYKCPTFIGKLEPRLFVYQFTFFLYIQKCIKNTENYYHSALLCLNYNIHRISGMFSHTTFLTAFDGGPIQNFVAVSAAILIRLRFFSFIFIVENWIYTIIFPMVTLKVPTF